MNTSKPNGNEPFVVGIDWMKPYWLAIEIRNSVITAHKLHDISEIDALFQHADAVWIDIPVGLPESNDEDMLRPDRNARNLLPTNRKSTIFPVPCRQAVYMDDYAQASAENQRFLGKKLTRQSHGFSRSIRQVDTFLSANPDWKNRLIESHPEVAFQMLNHGTGLQYSKHKAEGITERISILKHCGIDPIPLLAQFPTKQHEDVLDALCLALSAKHGCQSKIYTIPDNPSFDSRGLKMQMIFGMQTDRKEQQE